METREFKNWKTISAQDYAKFRVPEKNLIYAIVEQNQAVRFELNGENIDFNDVSISVKYKNGDFVCFEKDGNIELGIFKEYLGNDSFRLHCKYTVKNEMLYLQSGWSTIDLLNSTLATQKEINALYEVLVIHKYHWSYMTKTLEKISFT